jgi:hypothetical protein
MSFLNNSSNKEPKKVELTSSAKKFFRKPTEIKEDLNSNILLKSGNIKKSQIEVLFYL